MNANNTITTYAQNQWCPGCGNFGILAAVKLVLMEMNKEGIPIENFIIITGPPSLTGVRRRRSNLEHVQATEEILEVKKGATDEEVVKAAEKAKKTAFLKSG